MLHDRPLERIEAEQYANTFAGRMEDLERQAIASGDVGLMAQADQTNAHMRYMRDSALNSLVWTRG